jgi:hypothetical protein
VTRAATAAEADAFTRAMATAFHARVVRKSMAIEMQVLAQVLQLAQVADAGEFLEQFATTLGPFIYLPDHLTPDATIATMAHECQHVAQFWRDGLGMAWLYLAEPEARVRYEAEGYRAGLEVAYARGAPLPPFAALAQPLEHGYALAPEHVALGRDLLEIAATSVLAGVVSTSAGHAALNWLRAHAPDLLVRAP